MWSDAFIRAEMLRHFDARTHGTSEGARDSLDPFALACCLKSEVLERRFSTAAESFDPQVFVWCAQHGNKETSPTLGPRITGERVANECNRQDSSVVERTGGGRAGT